MESSVPAHGGTLVDQFVDPAQAADLTRRAASLPKIELDARELADLELIATGAVSPIKGFMASGDYSSVLEKMRLKSGVVWPIPITLAVSDDVLPTLRKSREAALVDSSGRLWGIMTIAEIFERNIENEATAVYKTTDKQHPGVAYLYSRPRWLVGGEVRVLPLPDDLPFSEHRLPPAILRKIIQDKGWKSVAGFQTRNPIHRAHEHLTKLALEFTDGLVIHPLMGETKSDDVPAAVRFDAYRALLDRYYPKDRTILSVFPAAMRYAGPREAIFHALVRKNYGITHMIVGRDHAGVGKYYKPFEAQEIFSRFTPEELGVTPLKFDITFYCRACENLASPRTCPHDKSSHLSLSGTEVRSILSAGGHLPIEFTRPEVESVLRNYYASQASPVTSNVPKPAAKHSGFVLWFTGLSGAGKSTLANALVERLKSSSVRQGIEILDGDEVRTYLSKGLGFSKEDRDDNIRRIGYVARLLARNGAIAITAAISPYASVRQEVRDLAARDGTPFIEVFVQAELESLVKRDVKGLYKKALAGEIKNFTGVSDPYEAPLNPEITVRSDKESIQESLTIILMSLRQRNLLGTD